MLETFLHACQFSPELILANIGYPQQNGSNWGPVRTKLPWQSWSVVGKLSAVVQRDTRIINSLATAVLWPFFGSDITNMDSEQVSRKLFRDIWRRLKLNK